MKNTLKVTLTCALVLLVGLSSASALAADSQDYDALLGTWDVTLTEMGMEMELIFTMDGDTITGEMVFDMGGAELEDIEFENGTLTFAATVDAGGQTVSLESTADISGDEIEGTMSSDMGDMGYIGTKRKDD